MHLPVEHRPIPTILVIGASGFAGRALAGALSAGGHSIRCLAPNPDRVANLAAAGCEIVQCDIVDPAVDTSPSAVAHANQACTLRALSALGSAIGGLDNVSRILFVRGLVHAQAGFHGHSSVLEEISRLMVAIFGNCGYHARAAVGVTGLPGGGMLEIEVTAAVAVS